MGLMQSEDKGRLLYVLADGLLREQVDVIHVSSVDELPVRGDETKLYLVQNSDVYYWSTWFEDVDGLETEKSGYKEGTNGAKLRIIKNDDGTEKMRKYELSYPGISGFITGVVTRDGDYGTSILVAIKDSNDEEFTLALQAKSKYGEDFLHKLPNIVLTKEVSIKPYNFVAEGDKKVSGVTLTQGGEKLTNAFNWKEGDEWKSVDGYPQVDEKKKPKNSDQWMVFFTQRREWVIEYLKEKGLITEMEAQAETPTATTEEEF